MAGGTGGHIFPALSIAEQLRQAGARVEWLGSTAGLENELVPADRYPLHRIAVRGLRGKGLVRLLLSPWMIGTATWQAYRLIGRLRPDCVLGMGGFVTGPGGVAAWLNGVKLMIHEQNAVPGVTNRLLAPLASKVMEAFPGTFRSRRRVLLTGNPVRQEIIASGRIREVQSQRPLRILVLGGSQGAAAVNRVLVQALADWQTGPRPEVWHQAGRTNLAETEALYRQQGIAAGPDLRVTGFIDNMAEAFAWADLAVCRSGASTVAELAVAGLPAILVPYPHHRDRQQSLNARWLAEAGAAIVIEQEDLSAEALLSALLTLERDRHELTAMSKAALARSITDAGERIAAQCLGVVHG